jgi:hypothetical protein
MISQATFSVGVSTLRRDDRAGPGADYDHHPVAPEVGMSSPKALPTWSMTTNPSQCDSGLGLGNDERVPPEQRGVNDRVPEARDREQLGNSLQNAEHYRLKVADVQRRDARAGGGWPRVWRECSQHVGVKGQGRMERGAKGALSDGYLSGNRQLVDL